MASYNSNYFNNNKNFTHIVYLTLQAEEDTITLNFLFVVYIIDFFCSCFFNLLKTSPLDFTWSFSTVKWLVLD